MSDYIIDKLRAHVSQQYRNDGILYIENVNVNDTVKISDEQIDKLEFHSSWENKNLDIIVRATNRFSLVINESKRIHALEVTDECHLNSLSITNAEISTVKIAGTIEGLDLSSCHISEMTLEQTNDDQKYVSHFHISNKTTIDHLVIDKYTCKKTSNNSSAVLIDNSTVNDLSIKGARFQYVDGNDGSANMFFSNRSTFQKLSIENVDYNERGDSKEDSDKIRTINLRDSTIDHFTIHNSKTEAICLESTTIPRGLFSKIENRQSLTFTGHNPVGSFLQFNDVKTGLLSFQNFTNFGDLRFINVGRADSHRKDKYSLQISYSDLGKTHFYNCDFGGKGGKIDFAHSRIQDIVILGHEFPCRIVTASSLQRDHESELMLLSQLSGVFQKNNDIANEIGYRGLALDALRKQKNYRRRADGFAIWLNKVSNNHSDGLGRSFFVLFAFSIVLYLIYVYLRGYTMGNDWKTTWFIIGNYFEFLSPIHKANYLMPGAYFMDRKEYNIVTEQVPGYIYFISGISKIIISYLIYQFIQAFRKYGRRS